MVRGQELPSARKTVGGGHGPRGPARRAVLGEWLPEDPRRVAPHHLARRGPRNELVRRDDGNDDGQSQEGSDPKRGEEEETDVHDREDGSDKHRPERESVKEAQVRRSDDLPTCALCGPSIECTWISLMEIDSRLRTIEGPLPQCAPLHESPEHEEDADALGDREKQQ